MTPNAHVLWLHSPLLSFVDDDQLLIGDLSAFFRKEDFIPKRLIDKPPTDRYRLS